MRTSFQQTIENALAVISSNDLERMKAVRSDQDCIQESLAFPNTDRFLPSMQFNSHAALGISHKDILLAATLQDRLANRSIHSPPNIPSLNHPVYRRNSEAHIRNTTISSDKMLFPNRRLSLVASPQSILEDVHARRHHSQSLLQLLQCASVGAAGNITLSSIQLPQQKNTNIEAQKTLQAIGCSLRKKNDNYIDVTSIDGLSEENAVRQTRGGVTELFPERLHRMLQEVEAEGKTDIVSFFPHGRAFSVHDPARFSSEIMPKYFKQTRMSSFQRQLNLYGFKRISSGEDSGGYYHELFLRGRVPLCYHMRRVGVPKSNDRKEQQKKTEVKPNFYSMKVVVKENRHNDVCP